MVSKKLGLPKEEQIYNCKGDYFTLGWGLFFIEALEEVVREIKGDRRYFISI
ncbi:hypothetical protein [Caldanaerobacter subterraneus]|uniref:Uncharacterized protein n=1 Tax=Caldanaerobacter subterraneus subsp. pacificus DSM 12653 TaxID=391606 RepID=A0A0F5PPW9_9THEO|nr:hypothetical protein [Caldanaerobacter subterraneus]KKC30456.1 hypothetical protein CDSM653_00470 [Caldanaerobacter subterraneus subsp. pacificus DSM 12653]